ncbi:MAG: Cna B-type domain-containing protein [Bifidobacteriaceae bacterium]|nr:Cna B-type domain-containing protein [Bifidobacteriaceae bacterium]
MRPKRENSRQGDKMTRHRLAARFAPALLCMLAMLAAFGFGAAPASAAENGEGTITANYFYKGQPVDGSEFLLYKVADWDWKQDTKLSDQLTPAFQSDTYKDVDWNLLDTKYEADENGEMPYAEDWYKLASTLFNVMKLDGFENTVRAAEAATDANGQVTFGDLTDGVYFLVSPLSSLPKAVYSAQLVSVPESSEKAATGDRAVSVTVKANPWSGNDPIHVKKIWDDGNATDRPSSIQVTLYYQYDEDGDFEKYETVELNAANNWSYEWARLPESMDYVVRETTVPTGYSMNMTVDRVSDTTSYWTITNTKPVTPVTPPATSTTTPNTPTVTTASTTVNSTPAQTGASIATVLAVGVSALLLGVVLIVKARRTER